MLYENGLSYANPINTVKISVNQAAPSEVRRAGAPNSTARAAPRGTKSTNGNKLSLMDMMCAS